MRGTQAAKAISPDPDGDLSICFASVFFLVLLLMYFLSLKIKLFPVIGSLSLKGLVMPVLTLALTLSAWYIRQVRAIIRKEMQGSYIDGLRARGMSERQILFGHVLRNCRSPLVTLIGISFGSMLGGTTIVESIFSWPGVGKLAVDAITARDYPVIQSYVVWMAVIYLSINYLIEFLYPLLDPRDRQEETEMKKKKMIKFRLIILMVLCAGLLLGAWIVRGHLIHEPFRTNVRQAFQAPDRVYFWDR